MGQLTFEEEVKIFNQNRSKYPHIKPIFESKEWSKYDYKTGNKVYLTLSEAQSG